MIFQLLPTDNLAASRILELSSTFRINDEEKIPMDEPNKIMQANYQILSKKCNMT